MLPKLQSDYESKVKKSVWRSIHIQFEVKWIWRTMRTKQSISANSNTCYFVSSGVAEQMRALNSQCKRKTIHLVENYSFFNGNHGLWTFLAIANLFLCASSNHIIETTEVWGILMISVTTLESGTLEERKPSS